MALADVRFPLKSFVWSSSSQKTICRTWPELSIAVKLVGICLIYIFKFKFKAASARRRTGNSLSFMELIYDPAASKTSDKSKAALLLDKFSHFFKWRKLTRRQLIVKQLNWFFKANVILSGHRLFYGVGTVVTCNHRINLYLYTKRSRCVRPASWKDPVWRHGPINASAPVESISSGEKRAKRDPVFM